MHRCIHAYLNVNLYVKKVKFHTYIAPLEVRGRLICGTLYITSPAGLLHPTLVWRFQEATNIPMQGGAWPVCPLMPWHYRYSFTPEWGEALSIWSKGVLNPSYLSFDSGQSRTRNLSHTSQELYHCATEARYVYVNRHTWLSVYRYVWMYTCILIFKQIWVSL